MGRGSMHTCAEHESLLLFFIFVFLVRAMDECSNGSAICDCHRGLWMVLNTIFDSVEKFKKRSVFWFRKTESARVSEVGRNLVGRGGVDRRSGQSGRAWSAKKGAADQYETDAADAERNDW